MIGYVIYTHNKINDARINQELARELFAKSKLGGAYIVHAYNGGKELGYSQYLEDEPIQLKNRGHFQGAMDLINAGVAACQKKNLKYVIVVAADTWSTNISFLERIIDQLGQEEKYLACSAWGRKRGESVWHVGFSQDFFVLDLEWNKQARLYPIDYDAYLKKFQDFNFALGGTVLVPERAVTYYWLKNWSRFYKDNDLARIVNQKYLRIEEREPVHSETWARTMEWPELGIYSWHEAEPKRKALAEIAKTIPLGQYGQSFLNGEIEL